MKNGIVLAALLALSGCETVTPLWQQDLHNINREWRPDYPVIEVSQPVQVKNARVPQICTWR